MQQSTARIKFNEHIGPAFNLESRVPQETVLRPTFYSLYMYTNDTPDPEPNNLTIIFADDVTQIMTTDKDRRTELCNQTQYEKE